jgi:hypothetical protein
LTKLNLINMERKAPLCRLTLSFLSLFHSSSGQNRSIKNTLNLTSYTKKLSLIIVASFLFVLSSLGQANGDYQTRANGNWDLNTTWQVRTGGIWVNCAVGDYPGAVAGAGNVTILNNNSVTLNINPPNAIGSLSFPAATANNTTLTLAAQTLNVTGAVTFGAPSVDGALQRIILGTGILNCASVNMPASASATRTIDILPVH